MGGWSLKEKEILIGVSGGIACYKAVELLRELKDEGANVQVVMTKNATEFVRPMTFEALSGRPVVAEIFVPDQEAQIGHIRLARRAELMAIVPATANIIGKIAAGIADDLLTTIVLAATAPILIAPAMNVAMYENPAVQENLRRVKSFGYLTVGPEAGELACGEEGYGRLASIPLILEAIRSALTPKDLAGERLLVTAGPTYEAIDPVRFIGNRSSGRMGYSLAVAAARRGASVTLISGPGSLPDPPEITVRRVTSAEEMREAVLKDFKDATVVIMAAAVTDFRPQSSSVSKLKRDRFPRALPLIQNPDILKELGAAKEDRLLVGFAAETDDIVVNAMAKLSSKKLDIIVANDISSADSGFAAGTNRAIVIQRAGGPEELPLMSKEELADLILDRVLALRKDRLDRG